MAATTTTTTRVCFSFAAYAKNVINHLKNCNVPVERGLNDVEFTAIESIFDLVFPPDLRSVLREGLPVGPGFPNWRSSSAQQLQILANLPILGLCKAVSQGRFWADSWGQRPADPEESVRIARRFLRKSPALVPIYRNFYIPSAPNLAGNPVFNVDGGDVRLASFDVAGFFQTADFRAGDGAVMAATLSGLMNAPAWAATEARRIEFWTETAERGERAAAREDTRGWWSGGGVHDDLDLGLGVCLEGVCLRLRDGGWTEDEVREMMMMDGRDEFDDQDRVVRDREGVVCHVRVLSLRLLRAGWSTEDVVDSLGCQADIGGGLPDGGGESWFDFQHTIASSLLKAC